MADWTEGYIADIGYTFGYYHELNPLRSRLAFALNGLAAPEISTACELGFGQGLSANIHAAAAAATWHGTDFNPAQVTFARDLAHASGASVHLSDEAFADFAHRPDLPDFDYIGLHGIWSWISDENRAVIVDFVRRRLKVGGVLYISYNTLPGWASFAPLRHLMTEHAEIIGAEGHGIVNRINGAIDFVDRFTATNPTYLRANPQIAERFKRIKDQNRHYLAHEYFNRDWDPMHFGTMAKWLAPARVSFACSAHFLDFYEAVNLTKEQSAFLQGIPSTVLRQSVRDFMTNSQFRRDYWVKGGRRLPALHQLEALRNERVVLIASRADISLKITGAAVEASLNASFYEPILDALSAHKPRSIGELEVAVKDRKMGFPQVLEAVMILTALGYVAPAQPESAAARARKHTDRLNAKLIDIARSGGDIAHLASPVTGGGVQLGRFEQLYLRAIANGRKLPAEWAQFAWEILSGQGQRLIKEGKQLETPEENLAELTVQAATFAERRLPIAKALQVA
jgi:SAM-dependent methyltransferase